MVRSAAGSVLIDGLYGAEAEGYHTPPAAALAMLRAARAPFDGVDLVLATHFHEDHFDAGVAAGFLRASEKTWFASTPQAVALLLARAPELAPRAVSIEAPEGVRVGRDFGPIRVEAFGLSHGKVNYAEVQHLGLVVTLD